MNRIYQGRVTKVQVPAPASANHEDGRKKEKKGEKIDWIDRSDGEAMLWRHHELFQDAVNYYYLALAAMAEGLRPESDDSRLKEIKSVELDLRNRKDSGKNTRNKRSEEEKKQDEMLEQRLSRLRMEESVWQWRQRVEEAWETVERGPDKFEGPKRRLADLLKLDASNQSFEAACKNLVQVSQATVRQRADALLRLLDLTGESAGDDGAALTPKCREKIAWLCTRKGALEAANDVEISEAENAAWQFAKKLHLSTTADFVKLSSELVPANFMTKERGELLIGKEAVRFFVEYANAIAPKADAHTGARTECAQYVRRLRKEQKIKKFEFRKPGAKVRLEYKAAKVFKEVPCPGVAAIFRQKTETLAKRKHVPILAHDALADGRVEGRPYFDYFANISFIAPPKVEPAKAKKRKQEQDVEDDDEAEQNRSHWFEFDLAAFVEAFKAPHRYCRDTIKRNDEREKLQSRIERMESEGDTPSEDSESETRESLPGFAGDKRVDMIKSALIRDKDLLGYLDDCPEEEADDAYPIHENTLRGWGKLRRAWREAAEKEEFKDDKLKLAAELNRIRLEQQGERPEDAGGGGLFKVLQKEVFWPIWRDNPAKDSNQADDPLWAWVKYCEMKSDVKRLEGPIRFTPAHAVQSPRYFIFPKQSREKKVPDNTGIKPGLKTDHARGVFAINNDGNVVEINGKEEWLGNRPHLMAFVGGLLVDTEQGIQPSPVRFLFSAPRLRRDGIREDGEGNLGKAAMLQPMMEALGIEDENPKVNFANCAVTLIAEELEDETEDDPAKKVKHRICFGFPVAVDGDALRNHSLFRHHERWSYRKSGIGQKNFAQFKYSAEEPRHEIALRWPIDEQYDAEAQKHDPNRKARNPVDRTWYRDNDGRFTCLSIDLGQRVGGAFAVLDARADGDFGANKNGKPVPSRFIGEADGKKWRAAVIDKGLLKLPGEDADVFVRPPLPSGFKKGRDKRPSWAFQEEAWGDRGRPALRKSDPGALLDETEEAQNLLKEFDQLDIMPPGWDKAGNKPSTLLSFPEQNDHLLKAFRRYISRIRRLHRWCAFLNLPEIDRKAPERKKRAIEEIREACGLDEGGKPKAEEPGRATPLEEKWLSETVRSLIENGKSDPRLYEALSDLLNPMLVKLDGHVMILANRCVPTRKNSWMWKISGEDKDGKPLHSLVQAGAPLRHVLMTMPNGKEQEVTWIRGQRGLSASRIEQIETLRRVLQSVNHLQRRKIGELPKRHARGDKGAPSLPDCCPKLLSKLDELKEQRVNQLAHQILALALGVQLKREGPTKNADQRTSSDIHGEYERIPCAHEKEGKRRPVDFIVLEDLEYYQTTQMRSRRENSRLMRWCRRHFRDKLKQLCELFGIPVVETNPADSSKFCSRSGVAGFRAVEVGPGFESGYTWKKALEKLERHERKEIKLEDDDLTRCLAIRELVEQMNQAKVIPTKDGSPRTLLAPDGTGNVFVPIAEIDDGYSQPQDGKPLFQFKMVPSDEPDGVLRPALVQADIGAAITLGLRAISDPRIWEIHPRVRTARISGKVQKPARKKGKAPIETIPPNANESTSEEKPSLKTREGRKFGPIAIPLDLGELSKSSAVYETRQPNYYRDRAGIAHWDRVIIEADSGNAKKMALVSSKALWGAVRSLQWDRCKKINDARIKAWEEKAAKPESSD